MNDSEFTLTTAPKIIHNTDYLRTAVGFYNNDLTYDGEVSLRGTETITYKRYSAILAYGFKDTIVFDEYSVYAVDGSEIPSEVKSEFEKMIIRTANDVKY